MHPLISDLSKLKDSEVESKIFELTKKYFATNNTELKTQIGMAMESYKQELQTRRQVAYQNMMQNRNQDLDKLINVN